MKLSEEIQSEIRAIKEELKASEKKDISKPKAIPPQYGLNRNAKKATKDDSKTTMAALANTLESLNTHDSFSDMILAQMTTVPE